jgi:hypothetical protein
MVPLCLKHHACPSPHLLAGTQQSPQLSGQSGPGTGKAQHMTRAVTLGLPRLRGQGSARAPHIAKGVGLGPC